MTGLKQASLLIIFIITILIFAQLTQLGSIIVDYSQGNDEPKLNEVITPAATSANYQNQRTRPDTDTENTAELHSSNRRLETSTLEVNPTAITDTEYADRNKSTLRISENDPYYDKQWAQNTIRIPEVWPITEGKPNVIVALLDTGIDNNHPDLVGKVVTNVDFTGSMMPCDVYGHGTHIAGIIVADVDNDVGISGIVPLCRLINAKVADDNGRSQASNIAEAIIWATNNRASVINISIEFHDPFEDLEKAVNYAWNHGAVVIAAAGNGGTQLPTYPAYYENCIAVTATRQDDTLAPLSNTGNWVDVAAPGFNIYSTMPHNSYGYKSGTSFATAYVSGIAAMLFGLAVDDNDNGRRNDEVRSAIELGCQPIGIEGVGHGRINAANSINILCNCDSVH